MDQQHLAFVINDVARLYRRRFDERTRSFGIAGPQMRALVQIMRFPGINQGALADRLDVEPITTCRMVCFRYSSSAGLLRGSNVIGVPP